MSKAKFKDFAKTFGFTCNYSGNAYVMFLTGPAENFEPLMLKIEEWSVPRQFLPFRVILNKQ